MRKINIKRMLSAVISLFVITTAVSGVFANADELSDDIVILYTNDVHTYIDGELSYDVIAAIKQELKKEYKYVFLADAGDHIQGTAYGSMDKGETIIKMMNAAKYDVATVGNHEFDYGMDGCMNAARLAEFPYISANFYREEDGKRTGNVFDSCKIFDCGDEKLAFVGITTPETFEKSTSAYFQDENGNFIYGISGGNNGEKLCGDVQTAVDEARANGADTVIALGHLGTDLSSSPWTSTETIANISGVNAFIDGHSHSTVKGETVKDKDGKDVLLTQTGSYFERIGMMVIDPDTQVIKTDFIECEKTDNGYKLKSDIYKSEEILSDNTVKNIKDDWILQTDKMLGDKIGFAEITLDNYDDNGNRLVRSTETNSGDFAADALYYLFDDMGMDVEVAIMNGGGVRNTAIDGDITYKTCKDMHTFGNVACLQTVSGSQILEALEWGARHAGTGENGGFLQVSGITYAIDTSVENTVAEDDMGTWVAPPKKYRVCDVKVYDKSTGEYKDLVLDKKYNLAGYNYTLRNLGDGYAMFDGAVNVLDYVMEDYMVLANYISGFENGVIGAKNSPLLKKYDGLKLDYGTVNGSGRIEIKHTDNVFGSVTDNDNITRAMLVEALYRAEGEPTANGAVRFSDIGEAAGFKNAVIWAENNGIVDGVTDELFVPNGNVTREQTATVLFRYARYKGIAPEGAWAIKLSYADLSDISDYAVEGVMFCTLKNIMNGKDNEMFAPRDYITKSETETVLKRFFASL